MDRLSLNPDEFDTSEIEQGRFGQITISLSLSDVPIAITSSVENGWLRWTFEYPSPAKTLPDREEHPDGAVAVGFNPRTKRIEFFEINLDKIARNQGIEEIKTQLRLKKESGVSVGKLSAKVAMQIIERKQSELLEQASN